MTDVHVYFNRPADKEDADLAQKHGGGEGEEDEVEAGYFVVELRQDEADHRRTEDGA